MLNVGVLALQGGVAEHMQALKEAARKAKIGCRIKPARTLPDLDNLDALVMPGGESTAMSKLLVDGGMMEKMRGLPALFGTCAGLILMAKEVEGAEEGQEFLKVMDVKVERNAYGAQMDSFEAKLEVAAGIGKTNAVFIRAPHIISTEMGVDVLASYGGKPVIVAQKIASGFLLGATFHPELTTPKVHEYFLKEVEKLL